MRTVKCGLNMNPSDVARIFENGEHIFSVSGTHGGSKLTFFILQTYAAYVGSLVLLLLKELRNNKKELQRPRCFWFGPNGKIDALACAWP
jgi:hypothetical protein